MPSAEKTVASPLYVRARDFRTTLAEQQAVLRTPYDSDRLGYFTPKGQEIRYVVVEPKHANGTSFSHPQDHIGKYCVSTQAQLERLVCGHALI